MQRPAQTRFALPSSRKAQNNFLSKNTPQGVFFVSQAKALRAFEMGSTFFFEKKVAKKQKSLQDLSALVTSAVNQNFLRLPEFDFCFAKITRNRGAFSQIADFHLLQNGTHQYQSHSRL
jgi:hypothetical protein